MLLGRDRECAVLDALLDGAPESRSGAVVLRGEPGTASRSELIRLDLGSEPAAVAV